MYVGVCGCVRVSRKSVEEEEEEEEGLISNSL